MMDKIAIFNQKGGVGKTNLTVNIAACLYKMYDKKVLIVDCDAQGNASSYLTGMSAEDLVLTLADVISEGVNVNECIIKTSVGPKNSTKPSKIDILPTNGSIDYIDIPSITTLRDIISPLEKQYDYCLFDCAPQKTPTSLNALCASDYVLVPVEPDADSVQGWSMVLDLVDDFRSRRENETIEIIGMVVNTYEKVAGIDDFFIKAYKDEFGDAIFKNTIRKSTVVKQARFFGTPVCYFNGNSPVAKDFEAVTKELVSKIKAKKRKVGK